MFMHWCQKKTFLHKLSFFNLIFILKIRFEKYLYYYFILRMSIVKVNRLCVCLCFQGSSTQEMWFTECWQQHNTSLHLWQTLTPASPETQLSSILTMVRDRRTGLCVYMFVCMCERDRGCPIWQKYVVEKYIGTEISNIYLSDLPIFKCSHPSKTLYLDLP